MLVQLLKVSFNEKHNRITGAQSHREQIFVVRIQANAGYVS